MSAEGVRRVHIVHGQLLGPSVGDRLSEHTTRTRINVSGYLLAVEGKGAPSLVLAGLLVGVNILVDPVDALPWDLLAPPPESMTADGPWDHDELGPWGQWVQANDLVVLTVQNPTRSSACASVDFHIAERKTARIVSAPPELAAQGVAMSTEPRNVRICGHLDRLARVRHDQLVIVTERSIAFELYTSRGESAFEIAHQWRELCPGFGEITVMLAADWFPSAAVLPCYAQLWTLEEWWRVRLDMVDVQRLARAVFP